MKRKPQQKKEYAVCLSFAGKDRHLAKEFADALHLIAPSVKVFYDRNYESRLWGANGADAFHQIYYRKSQFCVVFLSKRYLASDWCNYERQFIVARAKEQREPYLLVIRLDNSEMLGLPPTTIYMDRRSMPLDRIAYLLLEKLGKADQRAKRTFLLHPSHVAGTKDVAHKASKRVAERIYNKALDLFARNEWENALRTFSEAISHYDNFPEAYFNMGKCFRRLEDNDSAIEAFSLALNRNEKYADALHNRGLCWQDKGDLEMAIRDYKAALKIDPSRLMTLKNLCIVTALKPDLPTAIKGFRQLVKAYPDDAEVNYNFGAALARAGKSKEAIRYYRKTIELDPGHYRAYKNLGLLLLEAGKFSDAIEVLTQAIALAPGDSDAQKYLRKARKGLK